MKTIFYKKTEKENATFWFSGMPTKEWFILEGELYELNTNIPKRIIVNKYIESISVYEAHDTFSDEGIIRRIALI